MNIKYYLTRGGYLVEFWQNPCGCHPYDVIIRYENDKQGYSFSFRNHQGISAFARSRNLTRLLR